MIVLYVCLMIYNVYAVFSDNNISLNSYQEDFMFIINVQGCLREFLHDIRSIACSRISLWNFLYQPVKTVHISLYRMCIKFCG